MNDLWGRIKNNPAVVIGGVTAVLDMLILAGVGNNATAAWIIGAVTFLLTGPGTRQFVTGPETAKRLRARVAAVGTATTYARPEDIDQ